MTPAQVILAAGLLFCGAAAASQLGSVPVDLDHPAIEYRTRVPADPAAALNQRLRRGEAQLEYDPRTGYLRSLLNRLDVPVESQIAVFSGTSLQSRLISSRNPRVIYFNDTSVVAWMPGGFIEIAAQDPQQGISFYVLPQTAVPKPELVADDQQGTIQNRCLGCHYSAAADGVPGLLLRSVPATANGETLPWLGNYTTDHRSPFDERWGGWYVTGDPGPLRHMGNVAVADRRATELPSWNPTRVLPTLEGRVDTRAYLTPHSDIAALLVFDHQVRMMNLLTRFGWLARIAGSNPRALGELQMAAVEVVDYMLFVDEAPLGGVEGSSGFATAFAARGPRDARGRSLRDLDLGRRLLRYPCSYMVYSPAFDALPAAGREMILRRMKDVLSGAERAERYARLSAADRQAIVEILRATKDNLPDWF